MVLRVRPITTRSPTIILYTPMNSTVELWPFFDNLVNVRSNGAEELRTNCLINVNELGEDTSIKQATAAAVWTD